MQYCDLGLLEDKTVVPKIFIKNGSIVDLPDHYKTLDMQIDGVKYTTLDIPCINVEFKSGAKFCIACYVEGYKENDLFVWHTGGLLLPRYIKQIFMNIAQ